MNGEAAGLEIPLFGEKEKNDRAVVEALAIDYCPCFRRDDNTIDYCSCPSLRGESKIVLIGVNPCLIAVFFSFHLKKSPEYDIIYN